MKRAWQVGNVLSLAFALVANFLVATQKIGQPSIKDVSDMYATLLTPATYAFVIWTLIYILLAMFVIYQARDFLKPKKQNSLPQAIGPLFILSSLCNGLWTVTFVHRAIGLSVVFIVLLAASLYALLWRLRIALDNAPIAVIANVWWPLLIYTGWVTVASVTNVASWLQSSGIAITALLACAALVALLIGLLALLAVRNVRELLLASAWGIIAIGAQQLHYEKAVAITAFAVSGLLLVAVLVHGYKNRQTNPFRRLLKSRILPK